MGFNERMPFNRHEERELDRELIIKKAYEKALATVHEAELDPGDFRSHYSPEDVDADQTYVEEMEKKFESDLSEPQKLGTIFEAVLHESVSYRQWFGKESRAQKTSRYDDIKNGIDEVVETDLHDEETSYLGLALDATVGGTDEKFRRIKDEINKGTLSKVKYFRSKSTQYMGELQSVPRVVVAADAKTIIELAQLWLEKENTKLREHPFQYQVLEEISLQLEHFENYAHERGEAAIANTFARSRAVIEEIRNTKQESLPDSGKRDGGLGKVQGHLSIFSTKDQ